MRVGIVTIYDNTNHGNRLQNYALQQVLLRYADEVVTIKNKRRNDPGKSRLARMLPLAESPVLFRLLGKERRANMLRFTKRYIRLSRHCYWFDVEGTSPKKADQCDLYCAGSDQCWNPDMKIKGSFSYLRFAQRSQTFSYAASFGIDQIAPADQPIVRKGLEHVAHISVREDAGARIVRELTGRADVQVLVDPTMLLTPEEWDRVATAPKAKVPEHYILSFFIGQTNDRRQSQIREKAAELGCQVIDLMDPASPFHTCGPDGFLYLIRNACMVCTDSFHGSVFAFLFGKALAIFPRLGSGSNMGSRLATLTERFHLQDRMVGAEGLAAVPDIADYSAGYAALEQERARSAAFLQGIFQEAKA